MGMTKGQRKELPKWAKKLSETEQKKMSPRVNGIGRSNSRNHPKNNKKMRAVWTQ